MFENQKKSKTQMTKVLNKLDKFGDGDGDDCEIKPIVFVCSCSLKYRKEIFPFDNYDDDDDVLWESFAMIKSEYRFIIGDDDEDYVSNDDDDDDDDDCFPNCLQIISLKHSEYSKTEFLEWWIITIIHILMHPSIRPLLWKYISQLILKYNFAFVEFQQIQSL